MLPHAESSATGLAQRAACCYRFDETRPQKPSACRLAKVIQSTEKFSIAGHWIKSLAVLSDAQNWMAKCQPGRDGTAVAIIAISLAGIKTPVGLAHIA